MKLNEIFESIQGEGYFVGTRALFVRFAGCNLDCSFCDTDFSCKFEITEDELLKKIVKSKLTHIVLTGGEPTLQITERFVQFLKDEGFFVQIETNGTKEIPKNIDWITVSPKENWTIKKGNELKVVYQGQNLKNYLDSDFNYYYLQPCETNDKMNITETLKALQEDLKWKLSIQMHKLLKIK